MHPLRSVPPPPATATLREAWFAVEGDEAARRAAGQVVAALDGRELALSSEPGSKARYHAAATLAAGGAVGLLDAARELLGPSAVADEVAREALADLARGALENAGALGAANALTGPVARGDVDVVSGHLDVLERADPELARLYRALARRSLALARSRGGLAPDVAERLAGLLAGS